MTTIICAWCKTFLGSQPGPPHISHGICANCKQKQLKLIKSKTNEEAELTGK